jgi:hypothetical protein
MRDLEMRGELPGSAFPMKGRPVKVRSAGARHFQDYGLPESILLWMEKVMGEMLPDALLVRWGVSFESNYF